MVHRSQHLVVSPIKDNPGAIEALQLEPLAKYLESRVHDNVMNPVMTISDPIHKFKNQAWTAITGTKAEGSSAVQSSSSSLTRNIHEKIPIGGRKNDKGFWQHIYFHGFDVGCGKIAPGTVGCDFDGIYEFERVVPSKISSSETIYYRQIEPSRDSLLVFGRSVTSSSSQYRAVLLSNWSEYVAYATLLGRDDCASTDINDDTETLDSLACFVTSEQTQWYLMNRLSMDDEMSNPAFKAGVEVDHIRVSREEKKQLIPITAFPTDFAKFKQVNNYTS